MTYTLRMHFGGLCMFVRKKSQVSVPEAPNGLYVLLPNASMNPEPHCPLMITLAANDAGRQNYLTRIKGLSENLVSKSSVVGQPQTGLPPEVLRMSSYAGNIEVDAKYLATALPTDNLAARVILPVGAVLKHRGRLGKLLVPGGSNAGNDFAGIMTVDLKCSDDPFTIFGRSLHPTGNLMEIHILNVPFADLDTPKLGHKKGDEATHVQHYYGLLKDSTGMGSGPRVLKWEPDYPSNGVQPQPCPTQDGPYNGPIHFSDVRPPVSKTPVHQAYIEPLNCTVGGGCAVPGEC